MPSPIAIIEASSNLGLMPPAPGREPGTRKAPETFQQLGLYQMVSARKVISVDAQPYSADEQRRVNIRNMAAIAAHAVQLADAVERVVGEGYFPLVLGGDCSILIGSLVGLRRRQEQSALLFIDGHTDFFTPEQSATGGAAGMDLALATGWGPATLTDIEGKGPYVRADRVAALGNRDHVPRPSGPIPTIGGSGINYQPLSAMRERGMEASAAAALASIDGHSGFWIHVDVDVLDSRLMPAVDSPQEDGLTWDELETLLRAVLKGNAVGLQVTIYDPDRDPGLVAGRRLVSAIASVLGGSGDLAAAE